VKKPTDWYKEENLAAQSLGLIVPRTTELAENSAKTILQALTEPNVTNITFPAAEIPTSSGSKALPETKAEKSLEEKCCDQLSASFEVLRKNDRRMCKVGGCIHGANCE
jgi:hypothetical protein